MSELKGSHITWLGHATVLVQTSQGTNILIDPYIAENPKYPRDFKLPAKIDYILLTHAHSDHTADAVPMAKKYGATVVAIVELAGYMARKGVQSTVGMNLGGTLNVPGVAITMVSISMVSMVLALNHEPTIGKSPRPGIRSVVPFVFN